VQAPRVIPSLLMRRRALSFSESCAPGEQIGSSKSDSLAPAKTSTPVRLARSWRITDCRDHTSKQCRKSVALALGVGRRVKRCGTQTQPRLEVLSPSSPSESDAIDNGSLAGGGHRAGQSAEAVSVFERGWYLSLSKAATDAVAAYADVVSVPTCSERDAVARESTLGCQQSVSLPWVFAGSRRTTRSRGRAEERRRALLASRRRAP
jgi:hypothetical protein